MLSDDNDGLALERVRRKTRKKWLKRGAEVIKTPIEPKIGWSRVGRDDKSFAWLYLKNHIAAAPVFYIYVDRRRHRL